MLFLPMAKILALNVRKILLAMMQLPVAQIALAKYRGRLVATTSRVHWTVEIASKSQCGLKMGKIKMLYHTINFWGTCI